VVGMAANPFGAHWVGTLISPTAWPDYMRPAMMLLGVLVAKVISIATPARPIHGDLGRQLRAAAAQGPNPPK
jgi:hypothetical protein